MNIETPEYISILSPKEAAGILKKKVRWVYNHADELNGSKIGGSWFFTMEGIYDAIQRGRTVKKPTVSNKKRSIGKETKKSRRGLAKRAGYAHLL